MSGECPARFGTGFRQSGFTLIETLVVLVLVSIISLGSFALLQTFNNTDAALERRAEELRRFSMAMYRIDDDLRQLTVRPVKNAYNGYEPALRGDADELEFTRLGAANLVEEPRGQLQRLGYSLGFPEEQDDAVSRALDGEEAGALLLRSRWRVLDRAPDSEPVVEPLLMGVEALNLRYYDGDTETWLSQWPPVTARASLSQADTSLPRAIEMVLITRNGGELRRVFPLSRVTSRAGGSGGSSGGGRNSGSGGNNGDGRRGGRR